MDGRRAESWKRRSRELSRASEELGLEVLSSESFRVFVERERALAEREGFRFAVVALDVRPGTPATREVALAKVGKRIRGTDLLGWGERGELQVLLRHVENEAALEIAERLSAGIVDHATTVKAIVYPFPPPVAAPEPVEGE